MIKPKSPAPPLSFLLRHPAHLVACGFGSGLSPFAPGTAGTLFAWATYPLLRGMFPDETAFAVLLLLCFALGVTACQITGRALGVTDHGSIVWDEIVPFWAVLMLTPEEWYWQLAAFLWFRFYDIIKPSPADYFDKQVKNGFGVMMDDAIAAAYTVLTLALFKVIVDRLT
ncbi:MAG: phosphatidylglycerophosphatase A [Gammaproteobacteria bacterium]|nr:phosphatidylglycerophosphatase A [Rhodocyclaceae bacterium]MBU3909185.1 phosphatidylglycerophosphatase A [Gammaproteobacteria bacterium]MBU3990003.1 phosphatidylglycerophosphatase A [Gammaproteobacteria bacterium]MBU4005655.1 phosphatidylglycerophosphatase A [Gammaproteobacteria bacterium]MBU4020792.1 phosphatidylglycerophosphatase A [Gammaproteobacteria bacterium]